MQDVESAIQTSDCKVFWRKIKSLLSSDHVNNGVSNQDWFNYFNNLLNTKAVTPQSEFDKSVNFFIVEHDYENSECCNTSDVLSDTITDDEIRIAIKCLKFDKAPGI